MKEMLLAALQAGNALFLLTVVVVMIRRAFFKRDVRNILNNGNTTPELDDAARALHDVAHENGVEIVAVVFNIETGTRAAVAFGIASCAASNAQRADMLTVASNQLARTGEQVRSLTGDK